MMKSLFELAKKKQPTVLFFDEIDSLMGSRREGEQEASRRIKTEFMIQMDGAGTSSGDRILVIGATNTPWDLDEAVLRRLSKRIYIPLPDDETRRSLITNLMEKHCGGVAYAPPNKGIIGSFLSTVLGGASSSVGWGSLTEEEFYEVVILTGGYSASDLAAVCKEAAMGPVRDIPLAALATVKTEDMRPICFRDFQTAVQNIRPSVSADSLGAFDRWGEQYGLNK